MNAEMPRTVTVELHDGVAVLSISGPRGNALTMPLRKALAEALASVFANDAVRAVVLTGSKRFFSSDTGLDTAAELDAAPSLSDLCAMIEAAPKPVVAGLGGTVAGPGLELALAAHGRAAHSATQLLLPGVAWGLPPAAGTTQRLSRLAGAGMAADMLLDARIVVAREAAETGLVDRVVTGPRGSAFVAYANELAAGPLPPPTRENDDGLRDPDAYMAEVQRRRAAITHADGPAAPVLVRLIEAALILPFEAGLEMERAAHADALAAAETAALIHVARIEQRPLVPGVAARPLRDVAVLGADDGATLAAQMVAQGLAVRLIDPDEGLLQGRREVIATALEQNGGEIADLDTSTDLAACADADLIAVPGTGEIAAEYLRLAGLEGRTDAVIAGFGIDADPVALTGRPADTVWVHWPMEAGMRRHAALSGQGDAALATVAGLVRRFGRYPLRAAAPPSRPALALVATLLRCIERLLLKGATPAEIDAALVGAGWRQGPCRALDSLGLDRASALAGRAADEGWVPAPLGVAETLAEAGLSGRDAGQGLYRYEGGAPQGTSAALERAIAGARDDAPGGDEIVERVLAALALCGLRLLRDGAVATAADVDIAALHVLGMPRSWGGPMGAADTRGVLWLRGACRRFADDDPDLWEKPPEIDLLIRDRKRLSDDG